jgi:methylmalonyl-CoA carboxyltransferase 5S subunit
MFPQVAAKFFGTRADGPKNLSKSPAAAAASAAPAASNGKEPVRTPVSYDITVSGKTHTVTVQPA